MSKWNVVFTDEKGGERTAEVECHFAHNAPKVALKAFEGEQPPVLPGDFVSVVVTQGQ